MFTIIDDGKGNSKDSFRTLKSLELMLLRMATKSAH